MSVGAHATVTEALAAARAEMPPITKDQDGQAGPRRYKYADLRTVTEVVEPVLRRHGLLWLTLPVLIAETRFAVHWRLWHEASNTELSGHYPVGGSGPQEVGAALTYSRRYALTAVLGVTPYGDDSDAAPAPRPRRSSTTTDQLDPGARLDAASAGQVRTLAIELGKLGLPTREDKLTFLSGLVGRELSSSKELTVAEARSALATIRAQLEEQPV